MEPDLPKPGDPHPPSSGRMPGMDEMIARARRITKITGEPVVGGIAVVLHGWERSTRDIDVYSRNFAATHERLAAAGIPWDPVKRAHMIDGVQVHMVNEEMLGGPPKRTSTLEGVKVVSLADLVRAKLTSGFDGAKRTRDIADVSELIQRVPLKKDFVPKLPKHLRAPFKVLVDEIHGRRRRNMPAFTFLQKYFWSKAARKRGRRAGSASGRK